MCGFVGLAISDGPPVDRSAIAVACHELRHRGPDAEAYYHSRDNRVSLGFRRLSIIDLSAAGNQPMPNEDGAIRLVFNGEIYGYKPLRERLLRSGHVLRSQTDAETVLHLYEDHGDDALQLVNGMFALALWDEARQRVMLARDRLGIKPLYYSWDGTRLAFASELRAMFALGVARRIDPESLADYLSYGYVPFDQALVAGVKKLPAGHRLTLRLGDSQPRVEQWWDVEATGTIVDEDAAAEQLEGLLHTV